MAATPNDWKHLPFCAMAPVPLAARYSAAEFERLKKGLVPEVMEDKWFVYYAEPDLCFHRSWTGDAIYKVRLEPAGDGARIVEAFCATEGIEDDDLAYEGEVLDFLISNLLLGQSKPFPMPAGVEEPAPGVIQHIVAGTGYPER